MRYFPIAPSALEALPTHSSYLVVLNEAGQPYTNNDGLLIVGRLYARGTRPTHWLLGTESRTYFCLKGIAAEAHPETGLDRQMLVRSAESVRPNGLMPAGAIAGATDLLAFNHTAVGAPLYRFALCQHGYVINYEAAGTWADQKSAFCVEADRVGVHIEEFLRQSGVLCTACPS